MDRNNITGATDATALRNIVWAFINSGGGVYMNSNQPGGSYTPLEAYLGLLRDAPTAPVVPTIVPTGVSGEVIFSGVGSVYAYVGGDNYKTYTTPISGVADTYVGDGDEATPQRRFFIWRPSGCAKFTAVQSYGSAAAGLPDVFGWSPAASEQPALLTAHKVLGVAMTKATTGQQLAVMRRGLLRGITEQNGETWAVGDLLWAKAGGSITNSRPAAPLPSVLVGVIYADEGTGGPFTVAVDVRVLPSLGELSGVKVETPAAKDVFIHDGTSWEPRQLVHNSDLSGLTTAGAHPATAITNTPAGGIAATTVQDAIDEVEQEKAGLCFFYARGGF
jgi:hypothetical protein